MTNKFVSGVQNTEYNIVSLELYKIYVDRNSALPLRKYLPERLHPCVSSPQSHRNGRLVSSAMELQQCCNLGRVRR
jgi:hypothetical protein